MRNKNGTIEVVIDEESMLDLSLAETLVSDVKNDKQINLGGTIMNKEKMEYFIPELNIEGTMKDLLDWSFKYDSEYSDEALEFIRDQAKALGFAEEKYMIPELVRLSRARKPGTLPYEKIKLDKLIYGKISFSSTEKYGEVEITEDRGKVLIAISGLEPDGSFAAFNSYELNEFMHGDADFLEKEIGAVLFYNKV